MRRHRPLQSGRPQNALARRGFPPAAACGRRPWRGGSAAQGAARRGWRMAGGAPGMGRTHALPPSREGTQASSARVYPWRGSRKMSPHGAALADAPGVEHQQLVAQLRRHAQVVGDEQHGHVEARAQAGKQAEDLRLHGYIECRGRLIGDEQFRPAAQRQGEHHALPLPARELVWVLPEPPRRRIHAHQRQQFCGAPLCLRAGKAVEAQRFTKLAAHGEGAVQCCRCVLEHHAHAAATQAPERRRGSGGDILAAQQHLPLHTRPAGQQAGDGAGERALPAAGLAHHAQHAAARKAKRHAVQRLHGTRSRGEGHAQAAHVQQRLSHGRHLPDGCRARLAGRR